MDTMRGNFDSFAESGGHEPTDDDSALHMLPDAIGQDERRMQVRAYNHWASLLEDRNFPAIEDLEPQRLSDFGPYSVLLDFSTGVENPGIAYLGEKLARECDISEEELTTLSDVPSRSLLSRITDHYMQILANQAPIGFEAEFVNQRGLAIAYRGILLPYSSDDDTIDFIFGVINWKELADAQAADELLLEIDQALETKPKASALDADAPLTEWADGPGTELAAEPANDLTDFTTDAISEPDYPGQPEPREFPEGGGEIDGIPAPSFGLHDDEDEAEEPVRGPAFGSLLRMPIQTAKAPLELSSEPSAPGAEGAEGEFDEAGYTAPVADPGSPPLEMPERAPEIASLHRGTGEEHEASAAEIVTLPEIDPSEMELGDWLAAAREMAVAARGSEERTRDALYEAIGRAYDFSVAAAEAPAEFSELLSDSGLTVQARAPMTPVVKLVFGTDYDKTRLTEYAAALTHAHRLGLPRGTLGRFLGEADGGLKGVVKAERRLRREEAGKAVEPQGAPRHALAKKLRALPSQPFDAIAEQGSEFALVMIRRTENGEVVSLGEVPEDVALVERAARRLVD